MSSKKEALNNLLDRKGSTGSRTTVNTGSQPEIHPMEASGGKKKATFELDAKLHTRLKVYAAQQGKDMVEVVSEAVNLYLNERDA